MLTVDEYEVIRLVDLENQTHGQCAVMMDISRTTVTEMYESARHKIADSLVNGKTLYISGGHYRLCDGTAKCTEAAACMQRKKAGQGTIPKQKGTHQMRVAVTYENGDVYQHFGHTKFFKFYDIEGKKIVKEQVADTMGSSHGALAGFLTSNGVDALICGGIGGGAQTALANAGIQLYGGVSGSADEAAKALAAGNLDYAPTVHCSHHESHAHHGHPMEGHSCGEHSCGEDNGYHGNGGN